MNSKFLLSTLTVAATTISTTAVPALAANGWGVGSVPPGFARRWQNNSVNTGGSGILGAAGNGFYHHHNWANNGLNGTVGSNGWTNNLGANGLTNSFGANGSGLWHHRHHWRQNSMANSGMYGNGMYNPYNSGYGYNPNNSGMYGNGIVPAGGFPGSSGGGFLSGIFGNNGFNNGAIGNGIVGNGVMGNSGNLASRLATKQTFLQNLLSSGNLSASQTTSIQNRLAKLTTAQSNLASGTLAGGSGTGGWRRRFGH